MVKYSGMRALVFLFLLINLLVSCNNEDNSGGVSPQDANVGGTYVLNPDLLPADVILFDGFNYPVVNIVFPLSFPTRDGSIILEVQGLTRNESIYIYSDPECITDYLGSSPSLDEGFNFEILFGENYPDGHRKFYARLESFNGIFSQCFPLNIEHQLDRSAPVLPVSQIFSPKFQRSNQKNVEFKFEELEVNAKYKIYSDENCSVLEEEFVASADTKTINIPLGGGDKDYHFHLIRTDWLGNRSSCSDTNLLYTLDTEAPAEPIIKMVTESTNINEGENTLIHYPKPIIRVEGAELEANIKIFLGFNNQDKECVDPVYDSVVTEPFLNSGQVAEIELPLNKGEGDYKVFSQIIDPYGNASDCFEYDQIAYTYKLVNPVINRVNEQGQIINVSNNDDEIGDELSAESTKDSEDISENNEKNYYTTYVTSNLLRVSNLELHNKLELFYSLNSDIAECENPFFENRIDTKVISFLDFELSNGEGEYKVYSRIVDDFGAKSDCIQQPDAGYIFEFLKPKFSKLDPVLEAISSNSATIEFSDLYLNGRVNLFMGFDGSNSACEEPFFTGEIEDSSRQTYIELNSGDGFYRFYSQLADKHGNKSECFSYDLKYKVDTVNPAPPIAGEHIEIVSDSESEFQFIFNYGLSSDDDLLALYTDNDCNEELGRFEVNESGVYVAGIKNIQPQNINLYGKFIDQADNESACSELLASHEISFLKVSGTLTYDFVPVSSVGLLFDQTEARPMRNVYIELFDMDPDSELFETSIGSSNSDPDGKYEVLLNSPKKIKVVVYAKMKNPLTIVWDNYNGNAQYVASSSVHDVSSDEIIDLHAPSGWVGNDADGSYENPRVAAPFAIIDSIYSAVKKVTDLRSDLVFDPLYVNWSTQSADGAYYMPWSGNLYLQGKYPIDTDEFDTHLIVHEWGHYFENSLSRSNSMGGSHGVGDIKDMSLAFGEGFATGLSAMVFEPDAIYTDTLWWNNREWGFSMNVENDLVYADTNPGWFSEVSIQQMVYDLVDDDGGSEAHDSSELGLGPIIDVLVGDQITTPARTSIFSFIHALKSLHPEESSKIDAIVDNKGINTITDEWGTGNNAYLSMTGGETKTITLTGGSLANDLVSNKHIKYLATSNKTKFTFNGTSPYVANIIYKNTTPYDSGRSGSYNNANAEYSVTLDTIAGEYYSIRLFTSKDAVESALSVSVSIKSEDI